MQTEPPVPGTAVQVSPKGVQIDAAQEQSIAQVLLRQTRSRFGLPPRFSSHFGSVVRHALPGNVPVGKQAFWLAAQL